MSERSEAEITEHEVRFGQATWDAEAESYRCDECGELIYQNPATFRAEWIHGKAPWL